jgi:hypothetical protein
MKRCAAMWTAVLALALPLSAMALPSMEAAKSDSGMRFGEGPASAAKAAASAVYAGDAGAKTFSFENQRHDIALQSTRLSTIMAARSKQAPQPPQDDKESIGRIILRTAGGTAGLAATIAIAGAAPIALAMAAVGGAYVMGSKAHAEGKTNWQVIKQGFIGGLAGAASLMLIGDAAGDALGRGMERLFQR